VNRQRRYAPITMPIYVITMERSQRSRWPECAAELVGVCSATVYKWAAEGVLPHVRIVNVIRIRQEDLSRLLSAHALMPPSPPTRSP
jgi:excisionase family DNA binding protein